MIVSRSRHTLITAAIVFGASSSAYAATGSWQVGKVSGHAWMQSQQSAKIDLTVGLDVPVGMTVYTVDRARVLLVRGSESMLVAPGSVMAVGPGLAPGFDTTVIEQVGTVTFEVDKQARPHFAVETPSLAAVVKGTHFTVAVSAHEAHVSVDRGLVGVTSLATGQATDVSPGQHASVRSGPGGGMTVSGIHGAPAIEPGIPRAPIVPTVAAAKAAAAMARGVTQARSREAESYQATTAGVPATSAVSTATTPGSGNNSGNAASNTKSASAGSASSSTGSPSAASAGSMAGASAPGQTSTSSGAASSSSATGVTGAAAGASASSQASAASPAASSGASGASSSSGSGTTSTANGTQAAGSPTNGKSGTTKSDNGKGNAGTPGNGGANSKSKG